VTPTGCACQTWMFLCNSRQNCCRDGVDQVCRVIGSCERFDSSEGDVVSKQSSFGTEESSPGGQNFPANFSPEPSERLGGRGLVKRQGEQNREDDRCHYREIDTDLSIRTLVLYVTWKTMTRPAGQFLSDFHSPSPIWQFLCYLKEAPIRAWRWVYWCLRVDHGQRANQ
jgi:hypothetical protein